MIKPQADNSGSNFKKDDTPHKLFYKIGEVSRITNLEPYVLRYWETEFGFLKPRKGKSKQRMYQKKDIEMLVEIKRLLYDERFTIEGVRKRLSGKFDENGDTAAAMPDKPAATAEITAKQRIENIKSRLREIQLILRK
ncbi:MAG: MerR family transcriptional regulator [Candidatus Magnetominusculus sp. LBB02]|nr:MerR family transcriptional regulator [Candidatus Magnetominusculus sp. LBB02]